MKLSVNSKELLKSVQLVGACIKQKNTMPILDNLLLNISDSKLTIIADNLEIRSKIETEISCDENISTCVPYKLFSDILKGFPNTSLELEFDKKNLKIKSSSGDYKVPLIDSKEFPTPKDLKEFDIIKFDSLEFAEALKKAILFSEKDNTTNFSNILLSIGKEDTKIVAIDNAIIYEYSMDSQGEENEILISRDIARYLVQTITEEEQIELHFTENHFHLKYGLREISGIQAQGKLPAYNKIFDSVKPNKFLTISKELIAPIIKRLHSITDQNNFTLIFDLKENKLELSFFNSVYSYSAKETIDCDYQGEELRIGFNAGFILNMISTMDEEIRMELLRGNAPCLFFAENTKALVAPMAI